MINTHSITQITYLRTRDTWLSVEYGIPSCMAAVMTTHVMLPSVTVKFDLELSSVAMAPTNKSASEQY